MKRIIGLCLVLVLGLSMIGCAGGGAGDSGGSGDGTLTVRDEIASINPEQPAQVPGSLENAKSGVVSSSSLRMLASSVVDVSSEKGVFGRIMQDLMYNHLLDLVENPSEGSTARMFMALLKDVAEDPSVSFDLDTPIDLGTRPLPAGASGPDGETTLDLGTFIVTEVSAAETVVHWSVPFATLSDAPHGGVYYIRLNLIKTDTGPLHFETRMGFQPNDNNGPMVDGDGNPIVHMSSYEAIDTDGGIFQYYWGEEESQIFQQYTDSNGMLRTFFNAMVRRTDPVSEYDLLFLMIGDDTRAAIDAYQYDRTNPVQRSFEAYNQAGSLVSQIFYGTPQTSYRYPLKYVTKSGYALTTDDAGSYWLDSAGDDSFDADSDIDLTVDGAVVDYDYDPSSYDPNYPWDTGEYSTWDTGKTFIGEDITLLETATAITGLDSASQIAAVKTHLDDWLSEIASTIDVSSNDILTFPTEATDFYTELGLPLDPADFPTPY